MEIYGWSWAELQATPWYVRQFCSQVQHMKNRARSDDAPPPMPPGGVPYA